MDDVDEAAAINSAASGWENKSFAVFEVLEAYLRITEVRMLNIVKKFP